MPFPSGITTITLTGDYGYILGVPITGTITITPSAQLVDRNDRLILAQAPIEIRLAQGQFSVVLPCTDSPNLTPTGWTYSIVVELSNAPVDAFSFELPSSDRPTIDVAELTPVVPQPPVISYGGLATANTWTGTNTFSGAVDLAGTVTLDGTALSPPPGGTIDFLRGDGTWAIPPGGGGGAVSSVYGRTGAVTAQAGDYTAAQVGAIPTSAEGTAGGVATLGSGGQVPIGQIPVDGVAADFQPIGVASAGTVGKVADSGHVHPRPPWVFDVARYGAKGDNTTDDTGAIVNAINAAVAYAQSSGTYYAEVWFSPAIYKIAGALTKGGTTFGNAQIPLPIVGVSGSKVTLVLRGIADAAALPHWQQTTPQINGVVLRSTVQEAQDLMHGEASVIGGPTPQQNYGTAALTQFNNMLIVIDGLSIQVPYDHTNGWIGGFDFRGMAQARVISGSAFVSTYPSNTSIPNGSGYEFALAMPFPANNDYANIDSFSCEGFTYGVWLSEHCHVGSARAVYCYNGFVNIGSYENSGAEQHTAMWDYLSAEACQNALLTVSAGKMWCQVLDVENCNQHVVDPSATTTGYVGLSGLIDNIVVSDPTQLRVVYLDQAPGHVTAPAVPATTVSLRNPFWRDAAVSISGGTVTAITVDGVATGLTTGTVIVPSGRHITLTYTAAPTWTWVLL